MLPSPVFFADVCAAFELGNPLGEPDAISGGLSNRLYRLSTDQGSFAIKRMVANADSASFKANLESAFQFELLALSTGIGMPEPVPVASSREALARIADEEESCWVRVHRWISAAPIGASDIGPGERKTIAAMLARLHQIPAPAVHEPSSSLPPRDWRSALPKNLASPDLMQAIAEMEAIVSAGYSSASPTRVMAHRDLDQKNVLRAASGDLMLVDWDAAGPAIAEWDAVATALDWSDVREGSVSTEAFDDFLAAYVDAGGEIGPLTPVSFTGWCEGVLDWLWFNLERAAGDDPLERRLGVSEVALSARFIQPAAQWIAASCSMNAGVSDGCPAPGAGPRSSGRDDFRLSRFR